MGHSKYGIKKEAFLTGRNNKKIFRLLLFITSCVFTTIYLIWRTFFTIPLTYGIVAAVLGILLLAAEIMAALEAIIQYRQIRRRLVPEMPDIPEDWYPDVDVFVATHNEPPDLLYKTLNACNYMKYPDKSKVHIYLCDDKNRAEMAQLAAKMNVGYFGLSENKHAKAGNLNNALRKTYSPLVATFDSDMMPTSDFLIKTIPYFFLPYMKKDRQTGVWTEREAHEMNSDFKIGFIQAPQSFYNPDLFQFNLFSETRIPNEQDYFFREVNVGRNADNGVIYAGSNTVLSRKALEKVGYIATTSITEDFLTGLRIQKEGYTAYAVPDELAHGLAPNSVMSLLKQRERWGRGCIQALRQERLITTSRLSIWTKLSYWATWSYWWAFARRLIYIVSPIVSILFNVPVLNAFMWQVVVFWAPHYFFSNMALKFFSDGIRNRHWSNVYDTILFPYLIGPIFLEAIGIKKRAFVVTNKTRVKKERRDLSVFFALPHIELFLASFFALIVCIRYSIITNSIYSPVIFFWLIMNMKNIVFAIFFMFSRENFRMAERYYVREPVTVRYGEKEYRLKTIDISETGMAIISPEPVYFPPDSSVFLNIANDNYSADMTVRIIHVVPFGDKWKYSVQILEIDDKSKNNYMQIVYDRNHTMPRDLDATLSIFDDFNINFTKKAKITGQIQQSRLKTREVSARTLPRIKLGIPFDTENGGGIILDFNYHYAMLKYGESGVRPDENELLRLEIEPGGVLYLEALPEFAGHDNGLLHRVVNVDEFTGSEDTDNIVSTWVNLNRQGQIAKARATIVRKLAAQ